ncbi:MAG: ABC transporter substrate-binding protein [Solirubrobacteraceae bacterium]
MRKYLCAGVALALALAIAGCGGSKSQSSNTASNSGAGSSKSYAELRWAALTFAGPLNILKTIEPQSTSIEQLALQDLVEFEQSGRVKPGVANSVERPNPTTYVYHLRPVKFSDGKPLTSADVVFSLERNLGKEAWTKTYWEDVASVSPRGGSTVIVKLKRPSAIWEDVLAFTSQILEKAQVEKIGEKALGTPGNLPIGTGPWKFDSYQPEVGVQLSRNSYWTGPQQPAAKIDVSLFKTEASIALALRSGAIDGTFGYESPKIFANIPGTRPLTAPGTFVTVAGANTTRPPFNDVHVRRALAYASDAKGMISAGYPGGTAVENASIMSRSLFSNLGSASQVNEMLKTLPQYHFNLAAAKRELANSAYPHGFTTTIQVSAINSTWAQDAEILSSDLAKIGITAKVDEIQPDEETRLTAESSKLATLEVTGFPPVYPDPVAIISSFLAPSQIAPPGSGLNFASYRNPEFAKLESESIETLDPAKRLQLIGKILKTMAREAPYWPLYTVDQLGTLSEKYVYPTFSEWTSIFTPWALDVKLAS